jgi:hypothetical protein
MNRRDAAMIAHLDAIEHRITTLLMDMRRDIHQLREDVAGIKLELATHAHGQDEGQ